MQSASGEGWIEAYRTNASFAGPNSMHRVEVQDIVDLLEANGIRTVVSSARPHPYSMPLWDASSGFGDTISVLVLAVEKAKVIEVYEGLQEVDLAIDEDFDPGPPTEEV